jgi:adenylate cyclase
MSLPEALRELTRVLIGEPEFTPLDVAEQAGSDIEFARRMWRALGLPPVPDDHRAFTKTDIEILQSVRLMLDQGIVQPAAQLQMTRVIGQGLARVAEAQVSVAAEITGVAPEMITTIESVPPVIPELVRQLEVYLGYTWRRHLLAAIWRQAAATGELTAGEKPIVVGFADMVDFTAMSQHLSPSELEAVVERFEALVYDHVPEHGGRVVKMIGDEVMFAVDELPAAAGIALGLIEADGMARDGRGKARAGEPTLPPLRVGLACGPALNWEGDLFGPTVNLASRLVNIARPGTILVSEEAGEALAAREDLELRRIPTQSLKGIGRVHAYALRRTPRG